MLIIGLDPGLGCTGWGVIAAEGNRLAHVANGQVRTDPKQALPARLVQLEEELGRVIEAHRPGRGRGRGGVPQRESAIDAEARPGARRRPARRRAGAGSQVGEYAPRLVKKAVVGTGGAEKAQVHAMVQRLLPARRSPAPTPPTRSRSRSPTPTISPARGGCARGSDAA